MKTNIAAYIWPSYSGDDPRSWIFWPRRFGEWETVLDAKPKAPGHLWPRKPLWGCCNEADPYVMEIHINAALRHGINTFIYDWYWYDSRPFLEVCLDNGFLGAANSAAMDFYIMWANHDATYLWDRRNSKDEHAAVVWHGWQTMEEFRVIAARWIEKYFCCPNYFKIDGAPVVSVFDLGNFIKGFGSLTAAAAAVKFLNTQAQTAGFPEVHLQVCFSGESQITLPDGTKMSDMEAARHIGFQSYTNYNVPTMTWKGTMDWESVYANAAAYRSRAVKQPLPYFPCVSVGWDNNLRFPEKWHDAILTCTPAQLEQEIANAVQYLDDNPDLPARLVTINAWNEWTEGSYLLPDDLHGYGYLQAVHQAITHGNT
ncbi:MAG: glycoside hydrolase family 99-like domain-containing protein [Oscillospiraceae bacterium]|jgi:hypothetical protein|nr:glycoside hydrolase family 99-like domain-containing protein [Oscillospiraceae bacterium]